MIFSLWLLLVSLDILVCSSSRTLFIVFRCGPLISLIRRKPRRFLNLISSHWVIGYVVIICIVRILAFISLFIILGAALTTHSPRIIRSLLARLLVVRWATTTSRVGRNKVIRWLGLGWGGNHNPTLLLLLLLLAWFRLTRWFCRWIIRWGLVLLLRWVCTPSIYLLILLLFITWLCSLRWWACVLILHY